MPSPGPQPFRRTAMNRWGLLILAAAAGPAAPGCKTFEGNRALVPFFEVHQDPKDLPPSRLSISVIDDPPPAVTPREIGLPPGREVLVRPLFSISNHGPDHQRFLALWPLVDFRKESGERRQWILPFWYFQDRRDANGGTDRRWMVLFPLFYGGTVERGQRYFAFLPVAGKLRGILAKDEIDFFLLPLWWHSRDEDRHSLHILFPFYHRVWGGGWSGWRIWPFWGHFTFTAEDGRSRSDRSFVLWPFWISQENALNTLHPNRLTFIFPFYGRSESDKTLNETFLWPIHGRVLDKASGRVTHYGIIFPYRFSANQFDLWPLFGIKNASGPDSVGGIGALRWLDSGEAGPGNQRYRLFILWPIQRYDWSEDERMVTTMSWILPFWWRFHRLRKEDGAEETEWKLWPLFRYRRVKDDGSFYFISPIPWRQEVPFERFYERLWRLYLWRETPEWSGWEALYSVFTYRNLKTKDVRIFRILGGLFQRRTSPEGTTWRFFYLPWRPDED